MFRHLVINTIASAGAFFTVSVVGFVLIPVLVGTYGAKEFGLILLARVFLPTGVLMIFDFGFSELASQSTAAARETKAWDRASKEITILLVISATVGLALALLLVLGAGGIAAIFDADGQRAESFSGVVRMTGLALPLLFVVLVLEGIVKGYGAFRSLRLIEITCTLGYAAAVFALVASGQYYAAIAYAFLIMTVVRAALVAANAVRAGFGREVRPAANLGRPEISYMLPRCKLMAQGRILGVLQGPAQQPLVGYLLGPAAVAVYDVLVRLPRFAKTVIGLLGSALLPVAARLDAGNDAKRMNELASWGLLLCAGALIPPLAAAALLSEPLLRLWVGPAFSQYWQWHAAMFAIPVGSALISFGWTALLVRPHAVADMNRLAAMQVALTYGLIFAGLHVLQERAFLLAQCLAVAVMCPFALRLLAREHRLGGSVLRKVGGILLVGAIMAVVYAALGAPGQIQGWLRLAAESALWCLVYWSVIWLAVLDQQERDVLRVAAIRLLWPLPKADRSGA
jgi:O-antigen/teichoic acid export membrane protein